MADHGRRTRYDPFNLSCAQFLKDAIASATMTRCRATIPIPSSSAAGAASAARLGRSWYPVYGRETVLVADLELSEIPRAKFDFDAVGHYAHPDVFELRVDLAARCPVS